MACKAIALATWAIPPAAEPRIWRYINRRNPVKGEQSHQYPSSDYIVRSILWQRKGWGKSGATHRLYSLLTCCQPINDWQPTIILLKKEVIQPHLPVRLPCYDFTPLTRHTFGAAFLAVWLATSGTPNSGGMTGGVYKARERIHRAMLMRDY